ncbi:MAG: hypothetical protein QOF89_4795 [Acidobacteriota bacterium]|jgi:hypothetical protein|nr:hypothetical protein [Acidobacteriota bacterium]
MLEILALIYLTRKNGAIAEKKGHSRVWYKFLTVLLWLGGEIGGVILGTFLASGGEGGGPVYGLGLLGALMGAGLSRLIVNNLSSLAPVPTEVFD